MCPTGAAGLGGLLALLAASPVAARSGAGGSYAAADSDADGLDGPAVGPGERVAVLFTGRLRPGDPDPLTAQS